MSARRVMAGILAAAIVGACQVRADLVLDGVRDGAYGSAIATDPVGDLATPGPGEWSGTAWTDLTAIYAYSTLNTLWVYVDLPAFNNTISSGQIGFSIDINGTAAGGGTDPWGNAITFSQNFLPDYCIRGNIKSTVALSNDGWTELRKWNGSDWSTGAGTDWGGLKDAADLIGTKIGYANGNGLELAIPLSDIGAGAGDVVNLLFFSTESGANTKGAYDTVPSDDQSTGWDDPTQQLASVPYTLVPEPATATLMAVGGMILAFARLRRKTRASSPSDC